MQARVIRHRNPFSFGTLAQDEAFADRVEELDALVADAENSQDVVVFAPRRMGKSSLVAAAMRRLVDRGLLVADIDLWRIPSKEKLAEALAGAIYSDIASLRERAVEKALAPFRGLRIAPTMIVDPETGGMRFKFDFVSTPQDLDATLEQLLRLPAELAADQGKLAVLVLDEFQEITRIDKDLTKLMRSVFQQQTNVAHIYLGSRRHLMERIFNDENEPFWRSAKQVQLRAIPPDQFADFISERFIQTEKEIAPETVRRVLEVTGGHPYATQRLCYEIWQRTAQGAEAGDDEYDGGFGSVLASEDNHLGLLWEDSANVQQLVLLALAKQPGAILSQAYRAAHGLPAASSVQRAAETLVQRELVSKARDGRYGIEEPFLREWLISNVISFPH